MFARPLLIAAALAGGAWYVLYRYARTQRESSRPRAEPEYLQTWEGEGGAVPVGGSHTAAQVHPDDSPPSSRPANQGGG